MSYINIKSEIGPLKKVLLHRPGLEIQRLMPDFLTRMLFDDIPFLKKAQEEHDAFADILRKTGTEVLYLQDLLLETIQDQTVRESLIKDYCSESLHVLGSRRTAILESYLKELPVNELITRLFAGVLKEELPSINARFYALESEEDPFLTDPLPNLYFTRDPGASIGNGISVSHMKWPARQKETFFLSYILKYHPTIKNENIPLWYNRTNNTYMEGGDELVLSKDTIAVGISQRSNANSIERLALNLFNSDSGYKKVYGIYIPDSRVFMHLDTVFTMVDHDKFVLHPAVMTGSSLQVFCLEPNTKDSVKITEEKDLITMLTKVVGKTPKLIPCGGGHVIDAAREQWNDGSNTLTIRPGEVVTYSSNELSNKAMEDEGIKVHSFYGPELVRGRGGPRCMSMPLYREDI